MTAPTHPTYEDGTPILLGDQVDVPTAGHPSYAHGVVTEVRWIAHKGEAWIATDTGRNIVLRADDVRRAT